jgi:hypothetical protein
MARLVRKLKPFRQKTRRSPPRDTTEDQPVIKVGSMQLSTLSSGDLTPGHALPVPFDGMAMQAAACEE